MIKVQEVHLNNAYFLLGSKNLVSFMLYCMYSLQAMFVVIVGILYLIDVNVFLKIEFRLWKQQVRPITKNLR